MNEIIIKEVFFNTPEYKSELRLRDNVLRKPLGMDISDDALEIEVDDYHICAIINSKVVGTLLLRKFNNTTLQMRQVAVDESLRNKHIGKKLISFAESFAKDKGFTKIILNARKTAIPFYERISYKKIGEEFTEVGILHMKMTKDL
ncbi:GNAT family N-acetyltransferase [Clostridium sardiniense]|uniref:GNAT family N-acetyltransferase n=1 Tax=Clostridium sardiniense TaxID=29369 RepID=A0ABS7KYP3_CLOSR|nr:GNAT family N-acetyltransferase [Clostridium sardiniense]MBY0755934.1 GNAT family N-acetyltransferase [Clostridium sardiniense]MDQ0461336.1 putative GNAT family N-acyltransferase [Clostridium sardiniense]